MSLCMHEPMVIRTFYIYLKNILSGRGFKKILIC